MRVLTVIDGLGFAGGESRILSMGQCFNRNGVRHSVLALNPHGYSASEEFFARREQYAKGGVQVDELAAVAPERTRTIAGPAGKLYSKAGILRRGRRLARVIRAWQVDVVDSHLESAGLVSVLAGRLTGTPVSMTMYCGAWTGQENASADSDMVWPWTTRAALRWASGVLTDSHIRSRQMCALMPKHQNKFVVIPNGIPLPVSQRSRAEMRQLLGLPTDPSTRVVAQIGRFTPYKGQAVLLRAARKILDAEPNSAFLLVGYARESSYLTELRALASELGISDRVVMTEYPGPIGDVWQAVDIHAHASLFDSLPISIAEGMSLGKPAVVTSAGGIPEIVQHEQTGLVVPPGDADALAEALLRVLRSPDLAAQLGENARKRYEQLYQPESMARALEAYFTALVTRAAR